MTCDDFKRLLNEYFCGELDNAVAAVVEAHARECRSCAYELDQISRLDSALRRVVAGESADSIRLEQRVHQEIMAEVNAASAHAVPRPLLPRTRRRRLLDAIGLAAAGLLLAFAYQALAPHGGGILQAAAQDHHREVVDGQRRSWLRDPAAINTLLERNGVDQKSLASLAPAGYHLDRAKQCPLGGVLFVHLVFTNGSREFSVYLGAPVPRSKLPRASATGIYAADFDAGHVDCFETPRLTAMVVGKGTTGSTLASLLRSSL